MGGFICIFEKNVLHLHKEKQINKSNYEKRI